MDTKAHPILFFDGVCNLCDGFVQFVIKRDPEARFRFASLQSDFAKEYFKDQPVITKEMNTVVLLQGDHIYSHSDVGLRMCRYLGGLWPVFGVLRILPKGFRDRIYNWIARNRYRWFGKKDQCMVPTPDLAARFLS